MNWTSKLKGRDFTIAALTIVTLSILAINPSVDAAPCCAGTAAAPAIISGDDRGQLTAVASLGYAIGDAPDGGPAVFRSPDDTDATQTYKIDGAYVFSDRLQSGMSLPFISHTISNPSTHSTATSVGDIRADLAYEFLSDWNYSKWIPKGYVYLQGIMPAGESIYQAQEPDGVDASSKGFYALSLGSLFVKRWARWDAYAIPEIHYSFTRTFQQTSSEQLTVTPNFGGSFGLGVGVSPKGGALRIGLRLQPIYEQPKQITSNQSGSSSSGAQMSWDTALETSYLVDPDWSVLASYTDQTLLGPAYNTTLNRIVALALQRRWER